MKLGKVLVVGAAEAGKSTLIEALVPGAMNLAVEGRTVAMDHATLERGGSSLSLIGVPGQNHLEVVREVLAAGTRAAIWVHRAGEPTDPQTGGLVERLAARGVPYIVYINRHGDLCGDNGWRAPATCPEPREVVAGNLLTPGKSLSRLEDELWSMVQDEKGA